MISVRLARQLRDQGLEWTPQLHDFFVIPDSDLDDHVFVISELTIDVERSGASATIMFNGAVEWSLDYIRSREAVWLPTEEQLRELLGDQLATLARMDDGYRCEVRLDGVSVLFSADSASDSYAAALLHLQYAERSDVDALQLEKDAS